MRLQYSDMVATENNRNVRVITKHFEYPYAYTIDVRDRYRLISSQNERLVTFFSSRVLT